MQFESPVLVNRLTYDMAELPRLPFELITIIANYADPYTQARLAQVCRRLRDQIYSEQYGVDGPKLRYHGIVPGMITGGSQCVHPAFRYTYRMPNGPSLCEITCTAQMLRRCATTYYRCFHLHNVTIEETWDCATITVRTSCTGSTEFRECKLVNTRYCYPELKRSSDDEFETPPQKRITSAAAD